MKRICHVLLIVLLSLILFLLCSHKSSKGVFAQDDTSNILNRSDEIVVETENYHWQLMYWSDHTSACDLMIDHQGNPSDEDIENNCGETLFYEFKKSPECQIYIMENEGICSGLYLINISMIPITRTIVVKLSDPSIWLSITGCDYSEDSQYCIGEPELEFSGEEPLPNHRITHIQGYIDDEYFSCESDSCSIPLAQTTPEGAQITFWGNSSYGDSTAQFTALVRVLPNEGEKDTFTIDVISDQWIGKNPPSCSDIWQIFPESAELPEWLDTPQNASELRSDISLYYLAAILIKEGLVDASDCENGGLESDVTANECGLSKAKPKVEYWQNQFDQEILRTAIADDVPARLLKNIFIQESQLWPGIYHDIKEVGLGQLTENGADTTLLWNPDFYQSFCPLVLDTYTCSAGFATLSEEKQAILKGALLQKINASCTNCKEGVDMTKAAYSIHVFSETLRANCAQVDQLIMNTTGKNSREVSSYSDLWRFTLLNYNAGPGCLSTALQQTKDAGLLINWRNIAANLDSGCRNTVDYVQIVTNDSYTNNNE